MSIEEHTEDMRKLKLRLAPIFDKWIELLLPGWTVNILYHYERRHDKPFTRADAHSDWEYMRGHVNVWLPALLDDPVEDQNDTVVHELGHFVVCEMREYSTSDEIETHIIRHEERVVSNLTRILLTLERYAKHQEPSTEVSSV